MVGVAPDKHKSSNRCEQSHRDQQRLLHRSADEWLARETLEGEQGQDDEASDAVGQDATVEEGKVEILNHHDRVLVLAVLIIGSWHASDEVRGVSHVGQVDACRLEESVRDEEEDDIQNDKAPDAIVSHFLERSTQVLDS